MVRLRLLALWSPFVCAALIFGGCEAEPRNGGLGPVRVLIASGKSTCSVNSKGKVTVRNLSSRRSLYNGALVNPVTLKYSSKGIIVGDKIYKVDGLFIEPHPGSELHVNGRTYRGSVSVLRKNGTLDVINYVAIEDYVKGVITNEMVASWDEEALKAQAVAARSFAVYHILRHAERDYAIESTKIQYKGKDTEDSRTNRAVNKTKGEILYYNGSLLLPHFCTSCGGHTEYAGNVWEARFRFPEPVPCPYCRTSKEYDWQKTLSKAFVAQKLRNAGIDVKEVRAVLPRKKSLAGGRITQLAINDKGRTRTVGINDFRLAVGPDVVRSGFLVIENREADIVFRGKGWGHGVGMCQYGAKSMADMGYSYEAILSHYYAGSKLKRIRY